MKVCHSVANRLVSRACHHGVSSGLETPETGKTSCASPNKGRPAPIGDRPDIGAADHSSDKLGEISNLVSSFVVGWRRAQGCNPAQTPLTGRHPYNTEQPTPVRSGMRRYLRYGTKPKPCNSIIMFCSWSMNRQGPSPCDSRPSGPRGSSR